ncbi:beta-N-acetylhexosaminidase [Agarivorans sp. TSD2052]|uniref:beta-N-acetylhexosaminidase n=1 Tax=Agarivorans sp. TSD2052 TaxID=2937286 RepID=UPI00200C8EDA|nr:beta-N-acetylhexosaminidase [Agarivorans sp. TSD2052]UPW16854.1 beta-N-acetylhexosaminidase [Agarivorans sp. TSD2052]
MGPLFIDLLGTELSAEEREMLQHPLVAGVILFSRNYQDRAQLIALTRSIRAASQRKLLIAVDHEGGRVQRFREQFSAIPAMGLMAKGAEILKLSTTAWAKQLGWLMAAELRACDIDISFAPVLDINGVSDVIGLRAFSAQPSEIILSASAFIDGMALAGMKATGKHFPGHGNVKADTHHFEARDERPYAEIKQQDMQVFEALIAQNKLDAVMPAHVIYSDVDERPAGFSKIWLQQILRKELAFKGLIFSDDLSMKGAAIAGDHVDRAEQALAAGCNLLLACNDRQASIRLLDGLQHQRVPQAEGLIGKSYPHNWSELEAQAQYREIATRATQIAQMSSEWEI